MQLKLALRRFFEGHDQEGIRITFRLPESLKVVHSFDPDAYPLVSNVYFNIDSDIIAITYY